MFYRNSEKSLIVKHILTKRVHVLFFLGYILSYQHTPKKIKYQTVAELQQTCEMQATNLFLRMCLIFSIAQFLIVLQLLNFYQLWKLHLRKRWQLPAKAKTCVAKMSHRITQRNNRAKPICMRNQLTKLFPGKNMQKLQYTNFRKQ